MLDYVARYKFSYVFMYVCMYVISEVAADWHELMIPWCTFQPSIASDSEQLHPRCITQTYHCPKVNQSDTLPQDHVHLQRHMGVNNLPRVAVWQCSFRRQNILLLHLHGSYVFTSVCWMVGLYVITG